MKEKHFIILCFAISLLGLMVIYIADEMTQPEWVSISQINEGKNYVAFNATIIGIKRTDVGTFIKVKDNTGVIDVVVFDEKINTTGLNAGMSVKIIGKVQRYKGKLEIIPSSILR